MFRSFTCISVSLMLFTAPSWAQPIEVLQKGEKLAPYVAPVIYRATASEEQDEVVLQISAPAFRRVTDDVDAKPTGGWVYAWVAMPPLTLGREVEAFSQAGKLLSKEAVVKALAKPVSVACFVHDEYSEELDPHYLEVFRDGAVILVLKR